MRNSPDKCYEIREFEKRIIVKKVVINNQLDIFYDSDIFKEND